MRTLTLVATLWAATWAQEGNPGQPKLRFMLHGNMSTDLPTEDYLQFVERVKPDLLIMGVFDQRLYAKAFPDPKSKVKPLVPAEHLARWKQVAERLHKKGIRLIGQMELFVVSDRPAERPEKSGWFGFYDKGWDDRFLGKRPTKTVNYLEEPDWDRHAPPVKKPGVPEGDAVALCGCRVNSRALRGCANNPAWRAVQKAMVKAALDIGLDGFITNRNYFDHCACPHCQAGFRRWLAGRYSPAQVRERFGIPDLDKGALCVVGAQRDHDSVPGPLVVEKMRFARHAVKECFDDIYVDFARKRKADVIVAQWNHMAYFDELHLDRGHLPPATRTTFAHASADERWGLPADLWGKGESFFWYCNWGTTQNTILAKEYAGDTVLYGKYLRAMARGRPYVINKYDFYRPRVMMAEAAALGYLTNAIATPWQQAEDRQVVIRYFDFLRRHGSLYEGSESYAEVGLLFPRRALEAGDASPLEYVEAAGRTMIRQHVLFDMVPDDMLAQTDLGRYRVLVVAAPEFLADKDRHLLARFVQAGGKILVTPVSGEDRGRPGAATIQAQRRAAAARPLAFDVVEVSNARQNPGIILPRLKGLLGKDASRFEAPWTVEVHAYCQPRRLLVHLVNYNHKEKASGKSVSEREAPLAADPVAISLRLPEGFKVKSAAFLSPEDDRIHRLEFQQRGRMAELKTPGFLVYGLCVLEG